MNINSIVSSDIQISKDSEAQDRPNRADSPQTCSRKSSSSVGFQLMSPGRMGLPSGFYNAFYVIHHRITHEQDVTILII